MDSGSKREEQHLFFKEGLSEFRKHFFKSNGTLDEWHRYHVSDLRSVAIVFATCSGVFMKELILTIQLLCAGIPDKEAKIECYLHYNNCLQNNVTMQDVKAYCKRQFEKELK